MAHLLALLTNDPDLAPCQMHRLRDRIHFGDWNALGLGYYDDDAVLVAKRPGDVGAHDVAAQAAGLRSPALLALAQGAGFRFDEDATDPFRFRQWLFAMDGTIEGFSQVREKLELPALIARQILSATDREHAFGLFLRFLKEQGRLDDPNVPAPEAARCLGQAVREIDRLEREAGLTRPSPMAMVATNGRLMVAVRRGRPLYYMLQEGSGACEPCELTEADASDARMKPHRKSKTVVLATEPVDRSGFVEIPDGSTVAVGRSLEITVSSV